MSRAGSPLKSRMRKQKVVIELRVGDITVDDCAGGTIACAVPITTISGKETSVMTFCNDYESDVGTVALLECFAGRPDSFDFRIDNMCELTFRYTIAEE
jgi:hypothetical protein